MLRFRTLVSSAAAVVAAGILSFVLSPATPAAASNTYPYGQCTYFAKSQRPDIGNHWGDARFWDTSARANGFLVDHTPRVGDVVVFERYVQGNSPFGHVGIVAAVQGNQFKTVSMWGNEASGRVHVNWHHVGAGVSFIHRKGQSASTKAAPATTKAAAKPSTKAAVKPAGKAAVKPATKAKATVKPATKATAKPAAKATVKPAPKAPAKHKP